MSQRELKRLAKLIFQIAHREVWWGGRVQAERGRWGRVLKKVSPNWPEGVTIPQDWSVGVTWTLSPAVTLGGNSMQVCVSSHGDHRGHGVRVFVDGELGYPGGFYEHEDWWPFNLRFPSWSGRLARQEREEGGKTGHVDRRDLLIEEAADKLLGLTKVDHTPPELEMDPHVVAAVREVEDLVQRQQGVSARAPRPVAKK